MRIPGGSHPVHRDWFGLDGFLPGPRFTRDGAVLYLLETVGSTNEFLRGRGEPAAGRLCTWDGWGWRAQAPSELAPVAVPRPGTVVVARHQTRGRGRQGRRWLDTDGLNLSVVVPGHRAAFDQGFSVWLGLLTVLTLREDFSIDARLKWPNDITVETRKLGGILLETAGHGDEAVVVAGLGLNIGARAEQLPAELHGSATSVRMVTGHAPRPGDIAGRVLARIEASLDAFGREGWAPFRPALACLDCLLGRRVRVLVGATTHAGRAVGLDDRGRLLLETGAGTTVAVPAGDVHIQADAGPPPEEAP
ncbi:MAG: biotin--[acetyl-CoA-carboxylase] ligase [Candidatus Krumholzibacteriia bacterium]